MGKRNWSRREMLGASVGSVAATLFAEPLKAAAPATAVTPQQIAEAEKAIHSASTPEEREAAEAAHRALCQEQHQQLLAVHQKRQFERLTRTSF